MMRLASIISVAVTFVGKQRSSRGGSVGVYAQCGAAEFWEFNELDMAGNELLMLKAKCDF